MTKRMVVLLGGAVVLVGALAGFKVLQIKAAIAQASSFQPPPEAVTTAVATRAE